MTNHYHLFVETIEPTLSRGMQQLDGDFAARFNKRHGRVGHLFQGRFCSELVDSESYLLELSRYIVLNPVRARMVEQAGDWPWSSYRATAGLTKPPKWLAISTISDYFDRSDRATAARLFRQYVAAGVGQTRSPWEDLRAKAYLGSEEFIARVETLTAEREEKAHDSRRQRNVRATEIGVIEQIVEVAASTRLTPKKWSNEGARLAFALLARSEAVATYSAIGAILKVSTPGARKLDHRAREIQRTDQTFRALLDRCRLQISQLKIRV